VKSRFSPRVEFFPTVQAKPALLISQTGLTGLAPVGCRDGFLSRRVPVLLWLFLFKGGEVLEVFEVGLVSMAFWGFPGQTSLTGFLGL
jgi:hypothetical protein